MVTGDNCSLPFEGKRHLSTSIYFLLESGFVSKFYRLKSDELWIYNDGSPFIIHMIDSTGKLNSQKLGRNIEGGEFPQIIVPRNVVFGAEVLGEKSFSLVTNIVSPGFDYKDFELFSRSILIKMFPQHKELISRFNDSVKILFKQKRRFFI